MINTKSNLNYLVFIFILSFASCASYIPLNPEKENLDLMVKKGDELKIKTKKNEEIELKVEYLTDNEIIGEKKTVLFSDISEIEKMTASSGENILGVVLVSLLAAAQVALSSDDENYYYRDPDDNFILDDLVEATLNVTILGCYPDLHPGDVYYKNNAEYLITYKNDLNNCKSDCTRNMDCINETTSFNCESESQLEIRSCLNKCIKEKNYPIAKHVDDGYYSDGSYYKNCNNHSNKFENSHSLRNSYSKSSWQSVRDTCMELTIDSVKFESSFKSASTIDKLRIEYYNKCINESENSDNQE